ncbi:toll-like receptor 2 [Mobula hypostoma]|uniref:toll-like receptor 2 n=1 Tax=Mobula hypostoma TaxID=723540 RepID=UPI002FC2E443
MRKMRASSQCLLLVCIFVPATLSEDDRSDNTCQKCIPHNYCNCSSMKLKNIPLVSEKVLTFDLSFNNISQINDTDFIIYTELERLLLQSNQIQSITDHAFQLNTEVEYLDLSDNLLTKVTLNWFKQFYKLHYLNLSGNRYTTLGSERVFSNLSRLQWLEFGNPFLSHLTKDDFVGITHLDEFVLTANNLASYQQGTFSYFRNISHAVLSLHNIFLNKTGQAQQILVDLSGCTTHLELRDLTFPDNGDSRLFSVPRSSSFRKFTFKNTFLTDETVFNFIKWIKNTKVSEIVAKDCVLSGTGKWSKIDDVKNNLFHSLTLNNISIKHFYQFYDLSGISPVLQSIKRATLTKLNMFMVPCRISRNFKNAEYLDLTHNLLNDKIIQELACSGACPMLRYLILRKNILRSLSSTSTKLSTLSTLTHLDLSQNSFSENSATCKWPKNLQFLNLSSCNIQSISQCLPQNVEILDLSNNDISNFVVSLPSLKTLDLSNNKFKSLPANSNLPKMKLLKISSNKLTSLTSKALMAFIKLESLEAGKNNYICSCEFLLFMNHYKRVQLLDEPQNYVCDSPLTHRGQLVQNTKRSFFDCHMTWSIIIVCLSVSLAATMTGMACYKYHGIWYLQMTWAWLRAKRKPKKVMSNDICYDAFVSYSDMDSDWVENSLVRELESVNPPLALCLHKRDFMPGKWIIDNIIESIEKSRKTLFVLSQHFVQSEWCKYELDYTHFRLFDENNDSAILVLLEKIPKETIPQRFCKLRKLMNTKTYLEWSQDEEEQQIFWFNLKVALKGDDNVNESIIE